MEGRREAFEEAATELGNEGLRRLLLAGGHDVTRESAYRFDGEGLFPIVGGHSDGSFMMRFEMLEAGEGSARRGWAVGTASPDDAGEAVVRFSMAVAETAAWRDQDPSADMAFYDAMAETLLEERRRDGAGDVLPDIDDRRSHGAEGAPDDRVAAVAERLAALTGREIDAFLAGRRKRRTGDHVDVAIGDLRSLSDPARHGRIVVDRDGDAFTVDLSGAGNDRSLVLGGTIDRHGPRLRSAVAEPAANGDLRSTATMLARCHRETETVRERFCEAGIGARIKLFVTRGELDLLRRGARPAAGLFAYDEAEDRGRVAYGAVTKFIATLDPDDVRLPARPGMADHRGETALATLAAGFGTGRHRSLVIDTRSMRDAIGLPASEAAIEEAIAAMAVSAARERAMAAARAERPSRSNACPER